MEDKYVAEAKIRVARYIGNGVNASDCLEITRSIERWDDWCGVWAARAAMHEELGHAALAKNKHLSAAEHLCRATATYHFGHFLFTRDVTQMRSIHAKAVECHTLALPHMDPPGERVLIPYENTKLVGILRKPRNARGPVPVVLMIAGLDSTKEELITFETTFLDRGMATLSIDGPGQGEAQYELPIRADYENVVTPVVDWIAKRTDLDGNRIGIWGISLGGYYAPRAAAFEKRIKACVSNCGPYDWGALWAKYYDLTREAFCWRSHSANEAQGRERANLLTLKGVAERITCPLLVIRGGLDWIPAEDSQRLAKEANGPVELIVVDDGGHVVHNRPYRYRPQSGDWMAERLGV